MNDDDAVKYAEDIDIGTIDKGKKITHSITYNAHQVESYEVILRFTYSSDGQDYNETIDHRIGEYLNYSWKDKIRDWRL